MADTGAPGYIPLFDDNTPFTPIQAPFNAIATALNSALAADAKNKFKRIDTLANLNLPANAGTDYGQHATVYADPSATNNGDYYWTGTGWQRIYGGWNLMRPTAVTNGTITGLGSASFTSLNAGTNCGIQGVFIPAFIAYKAVINITGASAPANLTLQLLSGSTPSTTGYDLEAMYTPSASSAGAINININDSRWQIAVGAVTRRSTELLITSPAQAMSTLLTGIDNPYSGTGNTPTFVTGGHRPSTAFDGLAISALTNSITGTCAVYGLAA